MEKGRTQHRKEKHLSRQANRCNAKSNEIVARKKAMQEVAVAAFGLFCLLVLPRLMYPVIAASKGWI